ncbi:MAG TPA: helix-turn-helix transcriptional regulator [Verrucomicrobiae bacterium]|nr:helix-turn-helix transcriptional regulator [Verrucomicrobiae bacterium]
MHTQGHLKLHLHKLNRGDSWIPSEEALVFVFSKAGQGAYESGRTRQFLMAGDTLVIHAKPPGQLVPLNGDEFLFWSFSVAREQLFSMLSGGNISAFGPLLGALRGARVLSARNYPSAGEWLRWVSRVPTQTSLVHAGELIRIATRVLSQLDAASAPDSQSVDRTGVRARSLLDQLSTEDLLHSSVDELAKRLNCSRRHFSRLFTRRFGISMTALRTELRLLKAAALLRDPDPKVIVVAEKSGFNHLGLFNASFKRRFGMSPGKWRKSAMIAAPAERDCGVFANGLCPCLTEAVQSLGNARSSLLPVPAVIAEAAPGLRLRLRVKTKTLRPDSA